MCEPLGEFLQPLNICHKAPPIAPTGLFHSWLMLYSEKMMVDLANCIDTLSEWKEGCGLILQGANHTFCSGFDLLASQRYI